MKNRCPVKYVLEYVLQASPKVLYNYISTSEGLSEWFSDKVVFKDNIFHFYWGEYEQKARLVLKKEFEFIRLRWIDEEFNNYFEIRIDTESVSSDITLRIIDFSTEEEFEDAKQIWDNAVKKLFRVTGSSLVQLKL